MTKLYQDNWSLKIMATEDGGYLWELELDLTRDGHVGASQYLR